MIGALLQSWLALQLCVLAWQSAASTLSGPLQLKFPGRCARGWLPGCRHRAPGQCPQCPEASSSRAIILGKIAQPLCITLTAYPHRNSGDPAQASFLGQSNHA